MSESSVAAEVEQAFDVHGCIAAEFSFYAAACFDGFTNVSDGLFVEFADACLRCDGALLADIFCNETSYAVDAGERDFHAFSGRDIDSGDSRHR